MPWFPRDFIAATRHLALAERGAYRELLDHQWELGRLPTDEMRLARILGVTVDEFRPIWASICDKFESIGGALFNKRLEEHRKESLERRAKKVDGANKTNAKRYAIRDAERVDIASPPSPSPSPSKELRLRKEKRINFVAPVLDHVLEFMTEKGRPAEAAKFFSYYESNGWKVGKNKMQNWRAAAAGWISRADDKPNGRHVDTTIHYKTADEIEAEERARGDWDKPNASH